jgi:hypothetical protein
VQSCGSTVVVWQVGQGMISVVRHPASAAGSGSRASNCALWRRPTPPVKVGAGGVVKQSPGSTVVVSQVGQGMMSVGRQPSGAGSGSRATSISRRPTPPVRIAGTDGGVELQPTVVVLQVGQGMMRVVMHFAVMT